MQCSGTYAKFLCMPSKYITIRVLRIDVERVRRALKGHVFLEGTTVVRWFNWLSYMTGSEILATAKRSGPRAATELAERQDVGQDASYLLSDEAEEEAVQLDKDEGQE